MKAKKTDIFEDRTGFAYSAGVPVVRSFPSASIS